MQKKNIYIGASVVLLVFILKSFFEGGASKIDESILDEMRQEVLHSSNVSVEPTVSVSKVQFTPYTKEDLLSEFDALVNGYENGSQNFNHLAFMYVREYFDELSSAEQEKLRPYILLPTDPDSFFHISNWKKSSERISFLPDFFKTLLPVAHAFGADIEYFDDETGDYEFVQNGNIKVYYPSEDVIPEGIPIPPDEEGGDSSGDVDYDFLKETAISVLAGAVEANPKFQGFFGHSGPIEAVFYIVQDLQVGSMEASGFTGGCDAMYVSFDAASPDATAAHELFHCYQRLLDVAGLPDTLGGWLNVLSSDEGSQKWMTEGGAVIGEHIANESRNSEHRWFQQYVNNPGKTLFQRSYAATLFWFEVIDVYGESTTASNMIAYSGRDNQEQAELVSDQFHQIALNISGNNDLYDNGTATQPYDVEPVVVEPVYISESIATGEQLNLPLELGPVSMGYYDINIESSELDYLYFNLGKEIQGDDIEVSAYVYAGIDEYEKINIEETDEGSKYFILCATDNSVCEDEGRSSHEGMYSVFLVISNRSGDNSYSGDFTVTLFGPDQYEAFKVVMNQGALEVPVRGKLTLNINADEGEMKMTSRKFWLAFENDFYDWDSIEVPQSPNVEDVKIHPTRLTKYINNFCSFRGFIDFDFELKSEDVDGIWTVRKFDLKKKNQGDFHVTDHKFVCTMDPKMFELLGVNGPAVIVLQYMFASINTEQYSDGSFAMNLHRLFKEFMTLGLWDDNIGDIEMKFVWDDIIETIKIEFNDDLHIYFYRAN